MQCLNHKYCLKFIILHVTTAITIIIIRMIVIALIYGTIFYQLKTGTDESCYTNRLSLFFLITTNAFLLSVPVITQLFEGKEVGCID